LASHEAVLSKS